MLPFLDIFLSAYCELSQFRYRNAHEEMSAFFFVWSYFGDQHELLLITRSEWWPIFVHQLVEDLSNPVEVVRDNSFSTVSSLTHSHSNQELLIFTKTAIFDKIEFQIRTRAKCMKTAIVTLMNLLLSGYDFVQHAICNQSLMDALLNILYDTNPDDDVFQNSLEALVAILDCKEDSVTKFFIEHISVLDLLCSKIRDRGQPKTMIQIQTVIRGLFEIGVIYMMQIEDMDNPFVERVMANCELRERIEQGINHREEEVRVAFQSLAHIYFDVRSN
jgi:hypothetical protein